MGRSERTIRREIDQLEHDRQGTAKGPALKTGKDHKLGRYLEKAIGKEDESPYEAIQNSTNKDLQFERKIAI